MLNKSNDNKNVIIIVVVIVIIVIMFCDITLYELKIKEVRGEMAIQKHWNSKSYQSCIIICNSISKLLVVDWTRHTKCTRCILNYIHTIRTTNIIVVCHQLYGKHLTIYTH